MDELMPLSSSALQLKSFRLAFHALMDLSFWLCLSTVVRQQSLLVPLIRLGHYQWQCLGRSSSLAVLIRSSTPRVVAITRSSIPSSKCVSPFVFVTADLFYSSLGTESPCSDSLHRALLFYRSPTYFDTTISTTTPLMTSTRNRDQH